jgi:hypothetical protein
VKHNLLQRGPVVPPQIDIPPWTLSGWLWGMVGLCAAMLYIMGWYLLFAAPLTIVFVTLVVVINAFTESFDVALGIASFALSPLSIWFLTWQFFYFVGPAYIDILRSVGIPLLGAHRLTPMSAIAMVRQRRMRASAQLSNLLNWLCLQFRRHQS